MRLRISNPINRIRLSSEKIVLLLVFILGFLLFLSVIRSALFGTISSDKRLWFEITFLLLAALLAQVLVAYLRQPTVIGLLLIGALLSQSFINSAWPFLHSILSAFGLAAVFPATAPHFVSFEGVVAAFAQMGAIFLLFEAGMQAKIEDIFNKKNFLVALIGVLVSFAGGFAYSSLAGGGHARSLFYGAALTATSVGVTVSILMELGKISAPFAKTILGAAVIDDILSLLALSAVQGMGSSGTLDILSLAFFFFESAVFIGGGLLVGLWVVNRFSERSAGYQNRLFLLALAAVFFYSFAAELVGLSAIIGAFVAGLVLSQSRHAQEIISHAQPMAAFFTPMFFLSLGLFIDVTTLLPSLGAILCLSLIVLFSKTVGCGIGAWLSGMDPGTSFVVGLGMIPRGEMTLIIALLGLQAGALTSADYSVISSVAFVTTLAAPYFLRKLLK